MNEHSPESSNNSAPHWNHPTWVREPVGKRVVLDPLKNATSEASTNSTTPRSLEAEKIPLPPVLFNSISSSAVKALDIAQVALDPSESPESWNRYFSMKKGQWFLFNHTTKQIFWEAKQVATHWEKFMTPSGKYFYLNEVTGITSFENPDLSLRKNPIIMKKTSSAENSHDGPLFAEDKLATITTLDGEKKRSKWAASPVFMIANPQSQKRIAWDICVLVPLLLYLAVTMPFKMCFNFNSKIGTSMFNFEVLVDCIFIFDICLNFRTGYLDADEVVILDPMLAARNYLKSWFPLDLMSSIPFNIIDLMGSSSISAFSFLKSARVLKFLRILRFLKFARLLKGASILKRMDPNTRDQIEDLMADPTYKSTMRLLLISTAISFTAHIMACLWVLVGRIADQERAMNADREMGDWRGPYHWRGNPNTNWLQAQGFTYKLTKKKKYVRSIYLAAYYFVMTVMTSVGFGDVYGNCDMERAFVIVLEALGGFMYAIIVAALTSLVSTMDSNQRIVAEKLDAVASYIQNKNIPPLLGRRIRRHFRHYYSQKPGVNEADILSELSTVLRTEVSTFLVSGTMSKVSAFSAIEPHMWSKILPILRPAKYECGEVICAQGDASVDMLFVLEGSMLGETLVPTEIIHEVAVRSYEDMDSDDTLLLAQRLQQGGSRSHSRSAEDDATSSRVVEAQGGVNFQRSVQAGSTVNIACVVMLWNRSIETVKAQVPSECYAISAEDFADAFEENNVVEKILEKCVETMFHMVEDPGSPTTHGIPLFYFTGRETQERERRWEDKIAEERQLQSMSPAGKRMSMMNPGMGIQGARVAPM